MSNSEKGNMHRGQPKSDSRSTAATRSGTEQKQTAPPAGRIVHDSRGNAVWSWGKSGDDASATASTSKMLKKLDLGTLRVEDETQPESQPDKKKPGSGYGPGYNPYDRTAPVRIAPPKKGFSR